MTTYDIVNQGADDTGTNFIDPTLDDLVGSGDTVYFPAGDYLLESLTVPSGVTDFRVEGEPGTTIIPKDWGTSDSNRLIDVQGDGFEMDSFAINVNGRNPGTVFVEANDWEITRVATHGETHCETDGEAPGNSSVARTWFRPVVQDAGHTGLIEDCYFHDGANQTVSQGSNRRAILVERGAGDLTINRCWFRQWGENTIYAKKPKGEVNILNCYQKNTQNGIRVGGGTLIRNLVSEKTARHPPNWAGGQLMKGVSYEADDPATSYSDMDKYAGTLTVQDSDFNHDFVPSSEPYSNGAPIGGSNQPERAEIIDSRIYYNSNRSDDAIFTAKSPLGPMDHFALDNVHVTHDGVSGQYHVGVYDSPGTWGPVSGVLGGSDTNYSNETYVTDNMTTGGTPDAVDTTPPLPSPPAAGMAPMGGTEVLVIDNSNQTTDAAYSFDSSSGGYIWPTMKGDATEINMEWESPGTPSRGTASAIGTVPGGEVHAYHVDGSLDSASFTQDGDAQVYVDGQPLESQSVVSMLSNGSVEKLPDGSVSVDGSSVSFHILWNGEMHTILGK